MEDIDTQQQAIWSIVLIHDDRVYQPNNTLTLGPLTVPRKKYIKENVVPAVHYTKTCKIRDKNQILGLQ